MTTDRPPARIAADAGLPEPLDAVALAPVRSRIVPLRGRVGGIGAPRPAHLLRWRDVPVLTYS
ncbi:hypothetical protein ACH47Z_45295 [Streptomyces sp. NPDC020192]|uniref:hypothetical protein n=1 Tax=Streptomyces sp. NPDC020192 TaxID=3365066 RepID=UPI0037B5C27C